MNKGKIECVEGYHKDRINYAVKMYDESKAMKGAFSWVYMFEMAQEIHNK
ncbi:MAG: hypothetical protein KBS62_02830 [Oscillospiraceae bacterium]|nr:hypothetical protein [Candidatus Ruminococcus equi]